MISAFIHFYSRYFYKTVVVVQYSSTSATTSLLFMFFSETNRNGGSATERATQLKREHFLEKKAGERANLRLSRITVTVQWSITIKGQKKKRTKTRNDDDDDHFALLTYTEQKEEEAESWKGGSCLHANALGLIKRPFIFDTFTSYKDPFRIVELFVNCFKLDCLLSYVRYFSLVIFSFFCKSRCSSSTFPSQGKVNLQVVVRKSIIRCCKNTSLDLYCMYFSKYTWYLYVRRPRRKWK